MKAKSGRKRRRITEGAKARFLAGLNRGMQIEASAEAEGHSASGFYGARRRDPDFAARWAEALDASAGEVRIVPNNKRRWQRRKMRNVRFTEKRQAIFLAHFAGTCDATAAAAAAGVDESTIYKHRQRFPDFAAEWETVLELGYARLEVEALRQRIEAQQRLRDGSVPAGEIPAEFERVLKLLERWGRRGGKAGTRSVRPGWQQKWSFDSAMVALEKKLTALGYSLPEGEDQTGPRPNSLPRAGEGEKEE